jgi:quinohemoprotein ethanol dehydrogenase
MPVITARQNPQTVHEGALLFNSHCFLCHGLNAVARPLPDLRYSGREVLDSMESIVLGGSRAADGMPSFKKILTGKEVKAIRSYIIARAQESVKPTQVSQRR